MNRLGRDGEDLAASYIKGKGYRILERNFRTPFGEVDIIARDGEIVVFIEVKSRSGSAFGYPFEAVTTRKRERMRKVALCYLKKIRQEPPARFDVLSISVTDGAPSIEHIRDAFDV